MGMKKRIMVCVTQQKSCVQLIQRGSELASGKHDELHVIHVVKENWKHFGQLKEPDAMEYLFQTAKTYGADLTVVKATDIENTLRDFAEEHHIDIIVMGESLESSAQQNMIFRLQKKTAKKINFDIVPFDDLHPKPQGSTGKSS